MAGLAAVALISLGTAGVQKVKSHREKRKARRESILEAEAEHEARENRFASSKAREASEERQRRIEEEETEAREQERLGVPGPSRRSPAADQLGTHPALRRRRSLEYEAPPPYVKDAPSYEEHYTHAVPEQPEASQSQSQLQPSSSSAAEQAPKLSWRQRRRQQQEEDQYQYREFGALMRNGEQINMYGVPISQLNRPRERSPPRPGETEEQRLKRKRAEYYSWKRGRFSVLIGAGLPS